MEYAASRVYNAAFSWSLFTRYSRPHRLPVTSWLVVKMKLLLLIVLALTGCATPHREPLRRDPQAHDWSKGDWGRERFPNGHWE